MVFRAGKLDERIGPGKASIGYIGEVSHSFERVPLLLEAGRSYELASLSHARPSDSVISARGAAYARRVRTASALAIGDARKLVRQGLTPVDTFGTDDAVTWKLYNEINRPVGEKERDGYSMVVMEAYAATHKQYRDGLKFFRVGLDNISLKTGGVGVVIKERTEEPPLIIPPWMHRKE